MRVLLSLLVATASLALALLDVTVLNTHSFPLALFRHESRARARAGHTGYLQDIPPRSGVQFSVAGSGEVAMTVRHSEHSSLLLHMFVLTEDIAPGTQIVLQNLLSPTWLDSTAVSEAVSEYEHDSPLPHSHARNPTVLPYTATTPDAYCVLLRSVSTRPLTAVIFDKGVPSLQVLQPGELTAKWVVEGDTVLAYSDSVSEGASDVLNLTVIPTTRNGTGIILLSSEQYPTQSRSLLRMAEQHELFATTYLEVTGRRWLVQYDDTGAHVGHVVSGEVWPMRPADYIGQVHPVYSHTHNHTRIPATINTPPIMVSPRTLSLEVISVTPKAYVVEDFLTNDESDALLGLVGKHPGQPGRQEVEGVHFTTYPPRTSHHACLRREDHALVDVIFERAADVFGVSEELLHPYGTAGLSKDLQIIYYNTSGKFDLHSDASLGNSALRMITVLLYLYDQPSPSAGGETAFPRGGYKVAPKKGNALMYYNLLEDGNVDIDAQHESLPVTEGEKWVASLYFYPTATRYRSKDSPAYAC